MKISKIILLALFLFVFLTSIYSASALYETNLSSSAQSPDSAYFSVQELKFEPYPVSAGDWFNVWIKVTNLGKSDAPDAQFQILPTYPFYSNDTLVKDYGLIRGVTNAYRDSTHGETPSQENQIVLEYRIKVDDNASEGTYNLAFSSTTNGNQLNFITTNIPISVARTKTNFDVLFQTSSQQGVSFAVANTGSNPATAVTVSVDSQPGLIITGPSSTIVGNLNAGDFTTATFSLSTPNLTRTGSGSANGFANRGNFSNGNFTGGNRVSNVTIRIDYTDTAGIRNEITKSVPISSLSSLSGLSAGSFGARRTASSSTGFILPFITGIVIGGLVTFAILRYRNKKR